jgi:protein subunit release factor A
MKNEDVRFETYRPGVAGGQHVAMVSVAVRAIHIPTGTVIEENSYRSQHMNKEAALTRLRAIVDNKGEIL